jgi:hypothetical protein
MFWVKEKKTRMFNFMVILIPGHLYLSPKYANMILQMNNGISNINEMNWKKVGVGSMYNKKNKF